MFSWRQSRWLKVVAIAVILAFMPAQTSWAGRGRRGGNSTGDLVISAIGGASGPLTCVYFGVNPVTLLVTSGVRYGLTKAGCDPQTTMLVTAVAGGVHGSALDGDALFSGAMIKTVVKRVVAAEVTYELSQSEGSRWYAGIVGSMAGYMAGAGMEYASGNMDGIPITKTGKLANGKTITWTEKIPGFNDYMRGLPANSFNILVSGGLRALISEGLRSALDDSLAYRIYGSDVVSLAGAVGDKGAEELGILRTSDKYIVTDAIEQDKFQDLFQMTKLEATDTEIAKYEEEGSSPLLVFDKNKGVFERVEKRKDGKYWTVRYTPRGPYARVAEIMSLAEKGHRFMIEKDLTSEKVGNDLDKTMNLAERGYSFSIEREGVTAQKAGERLLVLRKAAGPGRFIKRKESREVTISYKKVPFSDKIEDTQIGGIQWGYREEKLPLEMEIPTEKFIEEGIRFEK